MDERGAYRKFEVQRTDGDPTGKHEHCVYFVLDMDCDPFALPALQAYAEACRDEHPALSRDLIDELSVRDRTSCGCREATCPHEPLLPGALTRAVNQDEGS